MTKPAVRKSETTAGKMTTWIRKIVAAGCTVFVLSWFCVSPVTFQVNAGNLPTQEIRTVSTVEKLSFGVTYIDDPTKYIGYTEFVSEGVTGEMRFEAQVLYKYGRADKVISIQNIQTGVPINRMIRRGTKVLTSQTINGEPSTKSFVSPLDAYFISCGFQGYRGHTGIDMAARYGAPVHAAAGGKVVLARWYGAYGNCVIIEHADGSSTLYAHNSSLVVYAGQEVKQGEQIARVGSTGNSTGTHLHFELRDGEQILNPLIYLDQ